MKYYNYYHLLLGISRYSEHKEISTNLFILHFASPFYTAHFVPHTLHRVLCTATLQLKINNDKFY